MLFAFTLQPRTFAIIIAVVFSLGFFCGVALSL